MTLHLSKYSSKIVKSAFTEDSDVLKKSLIDTVIIIFSSANIFNHSIGSKYSKNFDSIQSVGESVLNSFPTGKHNILLSLAVEISSTTGNMCKAVESLDHLEPYAFRESLLDSLHSLFELSLALACIVGVENIPEKISDRLYAVEKKNLFFDELGNYKEGYN